MAEGSLISLDAKISPKDLKLLFGNNGCVTKREQLVSINGTNTWRRDVSFREGIYQGLHLPSIPCMIMEKTGKLNQLYATWLIRLKQRSKLKSSLVQLYGINKIDENGLRTYELSLESPVKYIGGQPILTDLDQQICNDSSNVALSDDKRRQIYARYIHDVTIGLAFLHNELEIVHGNVFPEGIWMFEDKFDPKLMKARLSIFEIYSENDDICNGNCANGQCRSKVCFERGKQLDIEGLATTLFFTMSLGKEIPEDIKVSLHIAGPTGSKYAYTVRHLLSWMLDSDVDKRPDISRVKNHPAFWSDERSMEFIVEVAKCLMHLDTCGLQVELSNDLLRRWPEFNWKSDITPFVFNKLKKDPNDKTIEYFSNNHRSSLWELLKMLRATTVGHFYNIHDALFVDNYFGTDGENLVNFLLERLNYLSLYLYTMLSLNKYDHEDYWYIQLIRKNYKLCDENEIGYNFPPISQFQLVDPV